MVNEVAGCLQQYEDSISFSLEVYISVVERLSEKSENLFEKRLKNWIRPTLHLYRPMSQLLEETVLLLKRNGKHHEASCVFTCMTMERT